MNKKTKKRIRNLERRTAYLADMLEIVVEQQSSYLTEFEELEQEVAYLEAMVRHYIALYEQGQTTPTPTIVPSQGWPVPIPPGGLNIPYPYPFDTTTGTTLHEPKKYIGLGSTIGSGTAYEALRSSKLPEGDGR